MRRLEISRTQWAVGNGFFHSGTVRSEGEEFVYVYDCGALATPRARDALKREVSEFSRRSDSVGLFFISHFDYDHVSGVKDLAGAVTVDRFVIPQLPGGFRLFSAAGPTGPTPSDVTDVDREFYAGLISDPVAMLQELTGGGGQGVDVIVVEAGGEAPLAPDSVDDDLDQTKELSPGDLGAAEIGPLELDLSGGMTVLSCGGEVVWEFYYYVAEAWQRAFNRFVDELTGMRLISEEKDLDNSALVKHLVLHEMPSLRSAYDSAVNNGVGSSFTRNITSLMLYSGTPPGVPCRAYRSRISPVERAEIGAWGAMPGWLGLGDVDLRAKKRLREVNRVFSTCKPGVSVLAPSHHGSPLDWDLSLLDGLLDRDYAPIVVFAASGVYKHPGRDVLLEVNEAGGTAVVVGLQETSRWTEAMTVFVRH